jgi:hypothetical protein
MVKFTRRNTSPEKPTSATVSFDVCTGIKQISELDSLNLTHEIVESIRAVATQSHTPTTKKLIARLSKIEESNRLVLIKAAADWVVARYWRGYQNYERQLEVWQTEKKEWEHSHSELTKEAIGEFNLIFEQLAISEKNPRICSWENMKSGLDNCQYAGERIGKIRHGPLCVRYNSFFKDYFGTPRKGKKFFIENAKEYLEFGIKNKSLPTNECLDKYIEKDRKKKWFKEAWAAYLEFLGIKKFKLTKPVKLPHCVSFKSDTECEYNPHTELCRQYRELLNSNPHLHEVESLYREWRKQFLNPPKKPAFRYPSARKLPTPKIFGKDYFEVDWGNSIIKLRYEGKPEREFVSFGFVPWPKKYDIQPDETEITSAHVHFVGVKPRIGFRFEIPHKQSRFSIPQDDIDFLRSREFPRQKQDQEFLDAAKSLLLDSFDGNAEKEVRILAVDIGEKGAAAAYFEGKTYKEYSPLPVIKLDKLYESYPEDDKNKKPSAQKVKGLSKEHTGLHLKSWADGAQKIAQKRQTEIQQLGVHDMRRLNLHMKGMVRDWVRLNASQIIKVAEDYEVDLIVFESLRGFKPPGYDDISKKAEGKKKFLPFFSYGRIRRKVIEKAVERGMRVITVPYLKSSQFCSECLKEQENKGLWTKNKSNKIFDCEFCENKSDSDENAAKVLGRVFWGDIQLPVEMKT